MATSEKLEDLHAGTRAWIQKWCRKLKPSDVDWKTASNPSKHYNCMGFVCGPVRGKLRWWQSRIISEDGIDLTPTHYWPDEMRGDELDDFVRAARSVGFQPCDPGDEGWKEGSETIALYYQNNEQKPFVHAALCLQSGRALSKMAEHSDFEHPIEAFDDIICWYPVARKFMRRPLPKS